LPFSFSSQARSFFISFAGRKIFWIHRGLNTDRAVRHPPSWRRAATRPGAPLGDQRFMRHDRLQPVIAGAQRGSLRLHFTRCSTFFTRIYLFCAIICVNPATETDGCSNLPSERLGNGGDGANWKGSVPPGAMSTDTVG